MPLDGGQAPTIAAIIPLYNGAIFIRRALESVFNQTVAATDVIVVDDGSTDEGPTVVRAMIADGQPIRLMSKANGGQSSARNLGVARTDCELIAFLDQDDVWYPNHLAVLAEPFRRPRTGPPVGWTYSNLDEANGAGRITRRGALDFMPGTHPKTNLYSFLATNMYILPSASMISRAAFLAIGGFDERLSGYEDDDLFLRLFRAGYGHVYFSEALSKWCMHNESASWSPRMRVSGMIYARKLLAEYPDDPKRDFYPSRDYIAPRFLRVTQWTIFQAMRIGDPGAIHAAQEDLRYMIASVGRRTRAHEWILLVGAGRAWFAPLLTLTYTLIRPLRRGLRLAYTRLRHFRLALAARRKAILPGRKPHER